MWVATVAEFEEYGHITDTFVTQLLYCGISEDDARQAAWEYTTRMLTTRLNYDIVKQSDDYCLLRRYKAYKVVQVFNDKDALYRSL